MNILVIDDHPNLARVTALALRALGHATFTAGNTSAAAQLLDKEKIEGIFLDVNLGAESGWEYLADLGRRPTCPPVIMFSAQSKDEIAGEAVRRGAFGCLVKPFNIEDLKLQLQRLEKHWRDGAAGLPTKT